MTAVEKQRARGADQSIETRLDALDFGGLEREHKTARDKFHNFRRRTADAYYYWGAVLHRIRKETTKTAGWVNWLLGEKLNRGQASHAIRIYERAKERGGVDVLNGMTVKEAGVMLGIVVPRDAKLAAQPTTEARQDADAGSKAQETADTAETSNASQSASDADEELDDAGQVEVDALADAQQRAAMPRSAREIVQSQEREHQREQERERELQKPEHWLGMALDALAKVNVNKGSAADVRQLLTSIRKRVDELESEWNAFAVGFSDASAAMPTQPQSQPQTH